jgi:lysophospholipase L1-like esterase
MHQNGGMSFWLKGDGSDGFFAVELVDSSYALRYATLVPLKDTALHRVDIPWREFTPEIYSGGMLPFPLFTDDGGAYPHIARHLFIGRWFYFMNRFGPYHLSIDKITLENDLPYDDSDYTPAEAGIPRTLAKLRAKKPVTIVCAGDSITYGTKVEGPAGAYPGKFEDLLRKRFGYSGVAVINSGVGGLQTTQGSVLISRDVVPYEPDLVTVMYGYNDIVGGGAKEDQFKTAIGVYVDRVRRLTQGRTEVMLVSTIPGTSQEAWDKLAAASRAVRRVAAEKKCGLAEADKPFRALGRESLTKGYFAPGDAAHPNPKGQDLLARTLTDAVEAGGLPTAEK